MTSFYFEICILSCFSSWSEVWCRRALGRMAMVAVLQVKVPKQHQHRQLVAGRRNPDEIHLISGGFCHSWKLNQGYPFRVNPQFNNTVTQCPEPRYVQLFFSLKLLLCLPKLNHGSSSSCHVAVSISFNHGVGHKGPEHGMALIIWGNSKGGGKKGKAKGKGKGDEQNHENPGALSDNDWRLWNLWSLKSTGAIVHMFPVVLSWFLPLRPESHGLFRFVVTMPERCTFPTFDARVSYKMRRQQLQAVAGRGNADGEWMGMDWNISLYLLISIYGCHMVSRVFFTCYIFCYFLVGFVTFEIKPRVSLWGEPTI